MTRKISDGVARIKLGLAQRAALGKSRRPSRLGIRRRFRAGDVDDAAAEPTPDDYVIATGATHSVRDFVRIAFEVAGLGSFEPYVVIDPRFVRPAEVDMLIGDASKAQRELGWVPEVGFEQLVATMVEADIDRLSARARA